MNKDDKESTNSPSFQIPQDYINKLATGIPTEINKIAGLSAYKNFINVTGENLKLVSSISGSGYLKNYKSPLVELAATKLIEGLPNFKLPLGGFVNAISQIQDGLFKLPLTPEPTSGTKSLEEIKSLAFSDDMKKNSSPFSGKEAIVNSFSEYLQLIGKLTKKYGNLELVWRGQSNADWGLHSALYRELLKNKGIDGIPKNAKKKEFILPSEDEMVDAEKISLDVARRDWRLDGTPALELLAILQHYGAPTRLIDITKNPLIALWFACGGAEFDEKPPSNGRVFVLATRFVSENPNENYDPLIRLEDIWADPIPAWHYFGRDERESLDWGTGQARRVWFPPDYVSRIPSQNAGFLLDGVPIWNKRTASSFYKTLSPKHTYWNRNEVLLSASIYAKFYKVDERIRETVRKFAPTFSIVVENDAKKKIIDYLDKTFGINYSSLFPDKFALAQYLKKVQSYKK